MYLSRLEIFGFKSFAKKTRIDFHGGTTAIVGPNGCGKSNIVDAIRWVLGEQKAGILRSENMQNVIFNGTRTQKPLGMAEVSLTIQNTREVLPIEYSEVVVTRRLFRSGESQYLLNNSVCRLKDILDLFMDTGVGPNAYSVIELSMVEKILNGRPEERRQIFEEAAGVTKYKIRRRAAFRKLEATEQDLIRLSDIISEVEKTTNSLRRQVQKAQRYKKSRDELQQLELDYSAYHLAKINKELGPLSESSKEKGKTREQITAHLAGEEAFIEEKQAEILEIERQLSARRKDLFANAQRIQNKEEEILVSKERVTAAENAKARAAREIEDLRARQESLAQEKDDAQQALDSASAAAAQVEGQLREAEAALQKVQEHFESRRREGREIEQARLRSMEKVGEIQRALEKFDTAIGYDRKQVAVLQDEAIRLQAGQQELQQKLQDLEKRKQKCRQEAEKTAQAMHAAKEEIEQLRKELEQRQTEILQVQSQIRARRERMNLLRQFTETYEDYPEGVRHILLEKILGEGCHGTLGELIAVDEKYRKAAEVALGDAAVAVIVTEDATALDGVRNLETAKKGLATFIPLQSTYARPVPAGTAPAHLDNIEGVFGRLLDFVTAPEAYRQVLAHLLQHYYVVTDLTAARKLVLEAGTADLAAVTLRGEVVHGWGAIRGGDHDEADATLVNRRVVIDELEVQIHQLREQEKELETVFQEKKAHLQELREALEWAENKHAQEIAAVQEVEVALSEARVMQQRTSDRLAEIEDEKAAVEKRIAEAQKNRDQRQPDLERELAAREALEQEYSAFQQAIAAHEAEVKKQEDTVQKIRVAHATQSAERKHQEDNLARLQRTEQEIIEAIQRREEEIITATRQSEELQQRIAELREQLQDDFAERKELEEVIGEVEREYQSRKEQVETREKSLRQVRHDRDSLADELHGIELRIAELQMQKKNLIEHVAETYEMELEKHRVPDELDTAAAAERINELKQKIRSMEPVNLLALKDYESEKERLEFLLAQKEDLLKAEENLKETIRVINSTAYERFNSMYSKVRENFIQVFQGFFENGRADLRLDGNDPLEAEIVIEASPKGRKLESLALLSGGEKALTAISLLFALYLVKPSPFCILDEVDAPLDDTNVKRFTGALEKFSNNTQFIVVTHNKLTMKAANQLYGITMEEPGVSKIVSVKFEGDEEPAEQKVEAEA